MEQDKSDHYYGGTIEVTIELKLETVEFSFFIFNTLFLQKVMIIKIMYLADNYCPQNGGGNSFVTCAHYRSLLISLCSCEELLLKYKRNLLSFNHISSTSTVFQGF